jgi:hypothetical protein
MPDQNVADIGADDAIDLAAQFLAYAAVDAGASTKLRELVWSMYDESRSARSIDANVRETLSAFCASVMCHLQSTERGPPEWELIPTHVSPAS